ncbi:MAG: permease, partial [Candidatus Baltobacteraceae bacterium]
SGTAFGVIASACSYGAAAAGRGFYQKGADLRAIFAFMISSTNMNVAIVILFWSLLGWKFAFAEFFGGLIIIAIVTLGISLLFSKAELARLRALAPAPAPAAGSLVSECPLCGMAGETEHGVQIDGVTYLACGPNHEHKLREQLHQSSAANPPRPSLLEPAVWRTIWETAGADVAMLRNELVIGYVIAGFAAALIPSAWLAGILQAVGHVPVFGYLLLLVVGLLLAVLTFVCSMGNVPVARYLAMAGIPLGANVAFIYGDLLVPPLLSIYRKSFPPKVAWVFVGLFALGALVAGALMDLVIGHDFGGFALGSMGLNDRFTLISNAAGILVLLGVWAASLAAGRGKAPAAEL